MIINIEDEIFNKLKTELVSVNVEPEFNESTPDYPLVTFREITNVANPDTIDNLGDKHNQLAFQVDIYTVGNLKKSNAKQIRSDVDDILGGFYKMTRDFSDEVPNLTDTRIYRYTMRYSALVDDNKVIYRR